MKKENILAGILLLYLVYFSSFAYASIWLPLSENRTDFLYYNVLGDSLAGNMNASDFNITDIQNLVSNTIVTNTYINMTNGNITDVNKIFLDNEGHYIKLGMEEDSSGSEIANESFSLHHPEGHEGGTVLFSVDNTDDVNFWVIHKINGSASGVSNSFMAFPNNDLTDKKNISAIISIVQRWVNYGIQPFLSYHSEVNETSIASLFGIETQKIVFHNDLGNGGLIGEGTFDMTLDGNDANFFNGSIHNFIPVNFTSGFIPGQAFTILNVLFQGGISPFINEDVSPNVWFTASGSLCDEGECAEAVGNSGSSDITMTTNISTSNVNETQLNFIYALFNLIGADNIRVETNNFTGSGWEVQFTDGGTDNPTSVSVNLGETYSNLSTVGLRVVCDVTQPLRSCFIDSLIVNGTFTANTTAMVNDFDSEFCGADGSRDVNGDCNIGIRWDAKTSQWIFAGTLNATLATTSGISGSGTTNNWAKFTGSTAIGNAPISDDGSLIQTTLPLNVTGDINSSGNVQGVTQAEFNTLTDTSNADALHDHTESSVTVNHIGNCSGLNSCGNVLYSNNATSYLLNTGDTATGNYTFDSGTFFIDSTKDRIGIGNTAPAVSLEVGDETGEEIIRVSSGANSNAILSANSFSSTGNPLTQYIVAGGNNWVTGVDNADSDKYKISFHITDLGTNNFLAITTGGDVGIGTSSPTQKLDVRGNINASLFNVTVDCITFDSGGKICSI